MTADEFKTRRQSIGWTQKQAGEALGLSIPQIAAIENGRSKVTATVEKLFSFYKVGDWPNHPTGF